jgi:hypothetical protein
MDSGNGSTQPGGIGRASGWHLECRSGGPLAVAGRLLTVAGHSHLIQLAAYMSNNGLRTGRLSYPRTAGDTLRKRPIMLARRARRWSEHPPMQLRLVDRIQVQKVAVWLGPKCSLEFNRAALLPLATHAIRPPPRRPPAMRIVGESVPCGQYTKQQQQ